MTNEELSHLPKDKQELIKRLYDIQAKVDECADEIDRFIADIKKSAEEE